MKRLTFREREKVEFGPDACLTEADAGALEQLAHRLPDGALTWGHRSLTFGPFCGVVRTQQVTIEILPKVESGPQDPDEMRGLLVAMLVKAGLLRAKLTGAADLRYQRSHLLDVFIEDFCNEVKAALRGGAISRYQERTENLNSIRGRLELTAHLRTNAFDRSRLLCRFDERSIDNPYNRVLKAVLRLLLGHALSPRTCAMVTSLLHRFDDVAERSIGSRDVDALHFDRTIRQWQPVFRRAAWLAAGLFPDVRIGDTPGSALLFNMERLFETVLGHRLRRGCQAVAGRTLSVELQGPLANLAASGFQLRPDITVMEDDGVVAILDAKWKHLETGKSNSGVARDDAYQMNAYASRYRCDRLALVYPASHNRPPGRVTDFMLLTDGRPVLDVIAVDIRELAFGNTMPVGLEEFIKSTGRREPMTGSSSSFAVA